MQLLQVYICSNLSVSPQEYLQNEDPGLRWIIDRCGGRYHVINNRDQQDRDQVRELLEKVQPRFIVKAALMQSLHVLAHFSKCTVQVSIIHHHLNV